MFSMGAIYDLCPSQLPRLNAELNHAKQTGIIA
jgi:hypothetical protein